MRRETLLIILVAVFFGLFGYTIGLYKGEHQERIYERRADSLQVALKTVIKAFEGKKHGSGHMADDAVRALEHALVAYYPFNGNATDENRNGHDATVFGATLTSDRFGRRNKAFAFDGKDDYIDTFTSFDYPNRSISVWVWAEKIKGKHLNHHKIFVQDANTLTYGGWAAAFDAGKLFMVDGAGSGTQEVLYSDVSTGHWYHIVVAREGHRVTYYLDGEKIGESAAKGLSSTYDAYENLVLGAGRCRCRRFFEGKLDDVRIYNRGLTEAEVQALYTLEVQNGSS